MTPADYLASIVLPTLAEFQSDPSDPRRAYLACITAAHLVDHVSRAQRISRDEVRKAIAGSDPYVTCCLEIVEGIGNGTKHAAPDRRAKFPFVPGHERYAPASPLHVPEIGSIPGRWDNPGLIVAHRFIEGPGVGRYFIDDCVCAVVRECSAAFSMLLIGVDISSVAPELDRAAWFTTTLDALSQGRS